MARGFRVNFSVPELSQALDKISSYDGKARLAIENAIQSSTKAISVGARRRVPVSGFSHGSKGNLKKNIRSRFSRGKYGRGIIEGAVAGITPYAHLVEFGARAALEKPKSKKALTIDAYGNRWFSKHANIPKRSAHPFMRPAFEDEVPNLLKNLAAAVKP